MTDKRMPRTTKSGSGAPSECACGPFKPQADDQEIKADTPAEQVLAKIMLLCDDETGVFFFRSGAKLYLRVITREP